MSKKEFFFYLCLLSVVCVVLPVIVYQFTNNANKITVEAPRTFKENAIDKQEIAYVEPVLAEQIWKQPLPPKQEIIDYPVAENGPKQPSQSLSIEQNPDRFLSGPAKRASAAPSSYRSVQQMVDSKTVKTAENFPHARFYEDDDLQENATKTASKSSRPENFNQTNSFCPPDVPLPPIFTSTPLTPAPPPSVPMPLNVEPYICAAPCQESCTSAYQALACSAWEYPHRFYVDHVEGRWLDNHEGYTSVGFFSALRSIGFCNNIVPFIDARYHIFNDGKKAGNFGGGLRYINYQRHIAFGINAFYDFRESSWNHYYHDIGLGMEMLSPYLDVRLNGYIPVGKKNAFSSTEVFDNYIGDYEATLRRKKSSLWGVDGEIGRWLKKSSPCDFFDLYAAIGGHYFTSSHHEQKSLYGVDARLLTNLGSFFVFELRGGYDRVYHGMIQGRLTLSLPLELLYYGLGYMIGQCGPIQYGCCPPACNPCCGEFFEPVQRQEIMVLSKKNCCWTWNWDQEGCGCSRK